MVKCSTKWSLILQPEQRGCKGHCIVTVKVKQGKDSITYTFVGVVTSCLNFVFYVVAGCQATCTGWWFVPDFFNKLINSCSNSRWTYNLHIYMCMFTCHAAHLQLNLLTNDAIFHLQLPKRFKIGDVILPQSVGDIHKWLKIEMWDTLLQVISAPELCHIHKCVTRSRWLKIEIEML